jgi:hypothetical protein
VSETTEDATPESTEEQADVEEQGTPSEEVGELTDDEQADKSDDA